MRILVTGGTGFIGRPLCAALSEAGHELVVLSRDPGSVKARCGASVAPLASLAGWGDDQRIGAVINLAGEPVADARWSEARKERLWSSRVALTAALAERIATLRHKPSVLLSGSAIGVYGDCGDRCLNEFSLPCEDFLARLCVAWEEAAWAVRAHGVRVCLLRTGLVLHPAGGVLGRMLTPFRLGLGARLGDGRQWMSWIHLDDYLALALRLLADPSAQGPVNMTAPAPATNAEFTATLARVLRRPAFASAPAWLLKSVLGERASLLLGSQRALPVKALEQGFAFRHPQLEEALRELLKKDASRATRQARNS
jgi:hypothetical protein